MPWLQARLSLRAQHANGKQQLEDARLPGTTHLPDGGPSSSSSSSSNGATISTPMTTPSSNGASSIGGSGVGVQSRGMAVRLENVHFGYSGTLPFLTSTLLGSSRYVT